MSSLNYKLAAFLIVLGALSGIVCLMAYYLRDIGTKGKLSKRIPRWAKELAMSLSGQAMARWPFYPVWNGFGNSL